jgi:hypothetical protein
MRSTTYTLFNKETGRITGYISCPEKHLSRNVPEGYDSLPGRFSGRINLQTREAVDEPVRDHSKALAALARIQELEQKKIRPLTELTLDASNSEARKRLEALEAEIVKFRANLTE